MKKKKFPIVWFTPFLIWAKIILLLCLLPSKTFPQENWFHTYHVDKLVHASMFILLNCLLLFGFWKNSINKFLQRKIFFNSVAFFICITYGLFTEFLQKTLTTDRAFEWGDSVADTTGAFIGVFIFSFLSRKNFYFRQKKT